MFGLGINLGIFSSMMTKIKTGLLSFLSPATKNVQPVNQIVIPQISPIINSTSGQYKSIVSSDGRFVYVINYSLGYIYGYLRDLNTGVLTSFTRISVSNPYAITISSDGTSVYVVNYTSATISEYSRNTSTGVLTSIGTIATGTNPNGVIYPQLYIRSQKGEKLRGVIRAD